MLPDAMIDKLKNLVQKISKVEPHHTWIHVTHAITTMHAPNAEMVGVGGHTLEQVKQNEKKGLLFETAVMEAVKTAVKNASDYMQKARIGYGEGICDINGNRDQETSYGWWIGQKSNGISNKVLSVLKLENEQKEDIAYCLSYGVKPCAVDNPPSI